MAKKNKNGFTFVLVTSAITGFGFLAIQGFTGLFGDYTPVAKFLIGSIGVFAVAYLARKYLRIKIR